MIDVVIARELQYSSQLDYYRESIVGFDAIAVEPGNWSLDQVGSAVHQELEHPLFKDLVCKGLRVRVVGTKGLRSLTCARLDGK